MFCSNCGKNLSDTAKFCSSCGQKILANQIIQEVTPAPENITPVEVPVSENIIHNDIAPVEENIAQTEENVIDEVVTPIEENSVNDVTAPIEEDTTDNIIIQPKEMPVEMVSEPVEEISTAPIEESPAQESYAPEFIQPVESFEQNIDSNIEDKPQEEIIVQQSTMYAAEPSPLPEAPIAQAPIQEEVPAEKPPVVKKGFFAYVGLVVCFAFLLTFLTSFVAVLLGTTSISKSQIKNDINNVDVLNIKVGEIVTSEDFDVQKNDKIEDIIYKTIQANASPKLKDSIKEEDVKKIIKETNIQNYISEKFAGYADYITTGKDCDDISSKDIVNLIDENKDAIEKIIDKDITSGNLDNLENYLDENASEVIDSLSIKNVEKSIDKSNVPEFIYKKWFWIVSLIGLGILTALFAFFIFKINKNTAGSIVVLGSAFIASGALLLVSSLSFLIFKSSILDGIGNIKDIADKIMTVLLLRVVIYGAITFVIGLLAVVIKKLVYKLKGKKQEKLAVAQ